MRNEWFVVLALCAGSACAQDVTPPPGVTHVDARPAQQKKSKFESLTVWRCMYASRRIGDFDEGVQRIASLDAFLDAVPALAGKTVTVRNYLVHVNTKQASREMFATTMAASNMGAIGGGVAGAAMPSDKPGKVIGCAKDDLLGGYVSNEIPSPASPIVTVIDLDIDGRAFHFRSIVAPPTQTTEKHDPNFGIAHKKAIAELGPALERFLVN
jgi:hypothetical protein